MAEWYYVRNGQQAGPVTLAQLAQMLGNGQVKPDDLVWRDGMANWLDAGSVSELRVARPAAPPTATPTYPAPVVQPGYAMPPAAAPAGYQNAGPFAQPASTQIPVPQYYSQTAMMAPTAAHSRVGVASFIIALIAILLGIVGVIGSVVAVANPPVVSTASQSTTRTPVVVRSQSRPAKQAVSAGIIFAGCSMLIALGLNVAGLICGIISLRGQSRKLFGVLGTVFNGGMLLLVGGLMIVGMLMA